MNKMTLHIKVVQAILTRDTDTFNKMDPYCVVKIGNQKKSTHTKNQAGSKPVWNQVLTFSECTGNQLEVIVMDKDRFKDDTVGSGKLQLSKFMNSQQQFKQQVSLSYKGNPAGKIYLKIKKGSPVSSWGNNDVSNWNTSIHQGSNDNKNTGWGNSNGQGNNNNGWGNNSNNNGWGNINNNNGWGNNNNNGWGNSNNNSN